MELLVASAAMAVALGSPVGWAAGGAGTFQTSNPGANNSAAGGVGQKPDHAVIDVMPARQIVGRDPKDAQGIDAGKINSLVIDIMSGAVEFVMITSPVRSMPTND